MLETSILPRDICINDISKEDFYNKLYWDHRIYDIRCAEGYIKGHICRAHNMHPLPIISIGSILNIDEEINNDYGKSEHPSDVLIYRSKNIDLIESNVLDTLLCYLKSSSKSLKKIHILIDGYENFQLNYPYLCSDSIYYNESILLVWPTYITSNLYLGSSMCRNETIISLLKITHIMSFSDYQPRKIEMDNIKTIHWQISDSLSSNLLDIFPLAVKWILKSINDDKGIILVHCDQGVSRSASIIIAYLLTSDVNLCSVADAFNYVKSKRNVIRPNESFLKQLETYFYSFQLKERSCEI
ncbi:unnamed protein product [Adineta steineri]|uniref:protein-tyrosine-phosphatase n=1 Tax=Adineta steineri TaxID=433720 RepID=A0A814R242_9BILA|nr:unnamed protein product [Adineta steineri]CAF1468961.1 unnamed protein product [Adineta steineri]CAF1469499.1 unnamed protein product [Adineta steineri]